MKKSIKHLPLQTQKQLGVLMELIPQYLKNYCMVILYGSYARGGYVLWDKTVDECGRVKIYQSDLDILIVIPSRGIQAVESRVHKVTEKYERIFSNQRHPSVEIIVENLECINKRLKKSHYFFTDILKEGILLYDSKEHQLEKPKKLSFKEIKIISTDFYNDFYTDGKNFLQHAMYDLKDETYKLGAFHLHQTCEKFFKSILLVFTNYSPPNHRLETLGNMVNNLTRELEELFPLADPFEKRCYELLCSAYVDGRYNPNYKITKEEFEYLLNRVELFKKATEKLCLEKIASYDELIKTEK